MSRSGSETRRRTVQLKARFTEAEAALVRAQASRASVSVGALIRYAVLDQPPPRASRVPRIEQRSAGQIIAELGAIKTALRAACDQRGGGDALEPIIAAMHRDLAELRALIFEATGRDP